MTDERQAERSYRMRGYRFTLWSNAPLLQRPAGALLGPFETRPGPTSEPPAGLQGAPAYGLVDVGPDAPDRFRVFIDDRLLAHSQEPAPIVDALMRHLDAAVTQRTGDVLLLRGAAMRAPAGGGVVLAGARSRHAGAFALALLARGFGCLSPRAAAIDPVTRQLVPYPIPLRVYDDAATAAGVLPTLVADDTAWVRVDDARPGSVADPCDVSHVFALEHAEEENDVELLPASHTLADLGKHSLNLDLYRQRGLVLLAEVVQTATCHRLTWSDARAAAELVVTAVGSER